MNTDSQKKTLSKNKSSRVSFETSSLKSSLPASKPKKRAFLDLLSRKKQLSSGETPTLGQSLLRKIIGGETLANFRSTNLFRKILPIMRSKSKQSKNFLWIVFFVRKFISNLKEMTFSRKYKRLTTGHFALINDNSRVQRFFPLEQAKLKPNLLLLETSLKQRVRKFKLLVLNVSSWVLEKLFISLHCLNSKVPVFGPDRPFRVCYDILMLFYILCLLSSIALKQGFELQPDHYFQAFWVLFEILPVWIFCLDVLITLNTSYYSKGMFVSERGRILRHYVKFNLFTDAFSIIPLLFRNTNYGDFLELMAFFRVLTIEGLNKRLEEHLHLKGKTEGLFQLGKLLINLFFLAHMCACVWHYVGRWELSLGMYDTWLIRKGIELEQWPIQYIYSLYFAIVTMMTVGYGDISAGNYIECLFNIIIIIFGCGVFGYSLNNIGTIFKEMYYEDKEFK